MIKNESEIISYLENKNISIDDKVKYIESLNLQYSDLFKLKKIFCYDGPINAIIHSFIYYDDKNSLAKTNYQNRKYNNKEKQKRVKIRRYNNDKYKRR